MRVKPRWVPEIDPQKVLLLALVALLSVSCAKSPPKTPAAHLDSRSVATSTPVDRTERQSSAAAREPGEAIWSRELDEINRYVREKGLLADLYFDFDRAELRSDSRERLKSNASFLAERKDLEITIEGHCDERGTTEYNIVLGESRARAARDFLVSAGISPERVRVVTYGEEAPVCTESNEDCWWRNRRAHFKVTKSLSR